MLRRTLIGLVAIGILASFMGIGGFSLFIDSATNDGNEFTSGSVDISITTPASGPLWTLDNMAPGDSLIAQLTVHNGGSLQMRYAMTTLTTDEDLLDLDQALTLVIKEKTTNPCATFDGIQVYSGTLKAGVIGDPAPGDDDGDRTLDASASEDLCFKVTLPQDALGPMSASTTATFTLHAEQTKNNT